jgi:hypothetical protein
LLLAVYWVAGFAYLQSMGIHAPPALQWSPQLGSALFLLHIALLLLGRIPSWKKSPPTWPRILLLYGAWMAMVWATAWVGVKVGLGVTQLAGLPLLSDTLVLSLMPMVCAIGILGRATQTVPTTTTRPSAPQPIPSEADANTASPAPIHFQAELGNQVLSLHPHEIIAVEAANNYAKFHFQRNGQRGSEMLRISIKNVEAQLSPFPYMLRCHRSFLINGHYLRGMAGSSRSEKLWVADLEIPLSRTFDQSLLAPFLPPSQG